MKTIKKLFILICVTVVIFSSIPNENVLAKSSKNVQNVSKIKCIKLTKNYKLKVKFIVKSSKGAEWGDSFKLQKYENKKWVSLKRKDGISCADICYSTSGPQKIKKTYDLAAFYYEDELTPGKYRLKTDINFENPYVKFKIKKKAPKKGKYFSKTKVQFKKNENNIVYIRLCNGSEKTKSYGYGFNFQRKENNNWVNVEPLLNSTLTAYSLAPKSYVTLNYNLNKYYKEDQLTSGEYRLITGYNIKNNTVKFTIK